MSSQTIWRRGIAATLVAILATTLLPLPVHAADGFNLTISPLPINLTTNPGQPVSAPIRIQNTGNKAVKLKVSLMKFNALGASGEPRIEDPSPNDAFTKWVTFSKTSFVAQPNVFNSIDVTINPPKSAAFGYYYAVVFSQDNGNAPAVPTQSRINGAVASLILLNVNAPGAKRELDVVSFKSKQKLYQFLPSKFDVTVKNTGNIHVIPTGNVFISRPGSKDFLSTLSINEGQGNVLPKSSRVFTAEWGDGFPSYQIKRQNDQIISDSSGKPVKELSWNLKNAGKFRFGKYTASMTLVYNDGKQDVPVEGETTFWVIPWVPLLILLVLVGLIGVGIYVMLRSAMQRVKRVTKKTRYEA